MSDTIFCHALSHFNQNNKNPIIFFFHRSINRVPSFRTFNQIKTKHFSLFTIKFCWGMRSVNINNNRKSDKKKLKVYLSYTYIVLLRAEKLFPNNYTLFARSTHSNLYSLSNDFF